MKKSILLLLTVFLLGLSCSKAKDYEEIAPNNGGSTPPPVVTPTWKVIFEDNFEDNTLNSSWSNCPRRTSDWNKYIENNAQTLEVKNGLLMLRAIVNPDKSENAVAYLTSGIKTERKVNIKYGKIEVRAKFSKTGEGAWPAIWMMPEDQSSGWPGCGEIDIMERLNSDNIFYQTVHSHYVTTLGIKNDPVYSKKVSFSTNEFNTYGIEWYEDRISFTFNGTVTFTYPKIVTTKEGQWSFDKPFYLILNQAAGGGWPGSVNPSHLPFEMQVDWVKFYQLQ